MMRTITAIDLFSSLEMLELTDAMNDGGDRSALDCTSHLYKPEPSDVANERFSSDIGDYD